MSAPASRRQVLAAIALADVPMPSRISFIDDSGVVGVTLDRIAHLHPWAELTGVTAEQLGRALANVTTYTAGDEVRRQTALYPTWLGWRISLIAAEFAADPVDPVDDATREQLAAIAAAPAAAHHQVAGWVGVPGECGVECVCGVVFDHFGTIAEAAALLDDHIAAQAEGGAS